jgi:hypothetical protein
MPRINHVSAANHWSGRAGSDVLAVMENRELVAQAARQFVRRHGACAVDVLRERADCCAGDDVSAEAWLDIADAAERLLDDTNE